MKRILQLLRNELVTGAVLLAPVIGTIYIVYAVVSAIDGLFPNEYRPRVLGVPLPGLGIASVAATLGEAGIVRRNHFLGPPV